MPFSIPCEKCKKINTPYMDKKTEKVYCSLCNNEIVNITFFAKSQMKTLKQYKEKSTNAYSVKCDKCNSEETPEIINNKVVCNNCKKVLDKLSPIYINMLKDQLKQGHEVK